MFPIPPFKYTTEKHPPAPFWGVELWGEGGLEENGAAWRSSCCINRSLLNTPRVVCLVICAGLCFIIIIFKYPLLYPTGFSLSAS